MKNKEIYDLYEGLYEISQNHDLKFNIKTSYILAKDKHILEPYYNAIIETRQRFLDKYGELQDNGDWRIPKEKVKDFTREWNDFMEMENLIQLQGIELKDLEEERLNIELTEKLLSIINK